MRRGARPPADWMLTLAHNLSVVGFGELMFEAGGNFASHMGFDDCPCECQWAPGRGELYRRPSPCEQDDWGDEHERDDCPFCNFGCAECDPNVSDTALQFPDDGAELAAIDTAVSRERAKEGSK